MCFTVALISQGAAYLSPISHSPVIYYIHVMKEESVRFFFHFREIFKKCIEHIYRKIPDSFQ